MTRSLFWDTGE